MSFSGNYFLKQDFKSKIHVDVDNNLGIIVVIPCYDEPDIISTLNSLKNCHSPKSVVEIIIVLNSSNISSNQAIEQNKKSFQEIKMWDLENQNKAFDVHIVEKNNIPKKFTGAGYPRKIGMDEAANRFNLINNPNGIIISLDADCLVDNNYFTEIESFYLANSKANACNIYFEHPIEGKDFDNSVYNAITEYELYLRYYVQVLKVINFPYAIHTVGSCFTVKANVYVKQGGMNRRNAGEDFYFLQKIIPLGNFHELNTTRVIPSPRASLRVPFGTGAAINKFVNEGEKEIKTYCLQSFFDLETLFKRIDELYNIKSASIFIEEMPHILSKYLISIDFEKIVLDTNNNSSSIESFRKRFYSHFNAFRVLKYLNFSHLDYYKLSPVKKLSKELLQQMELKTIPENLKKLLILFRELEKQKK